jgi:Cu/Ag efflux pump CusA
MAMVILCGLISSTLLNMIVVPAVYYWAAFSRRDLRIFMSSFI